MVTVHINNTKHITIYIPPRDSTSTHYKKAGMHIQRYIAHHKYTTLSPRRAKHHTTTKSSPDITTVSNTLYNRTSWTTQHALSSDHLPLITTINIRHDYRLQRNWRTQFTDDRESAYAQTTILTNIDTVNSIFTNIILMADKHKLPKDKIHSNRMLLPDHILCKITQGNKLMRANICDPALKVLNEEITSDIQKHKQPYMEGASICTLGSQAQHTHPLEYHTRSIQ